MSTARSAHTSTLLRDGRTLIAGGFTEQGAAPDAELFDATSNRYSPLARMMVVRHSHTATMLNDGKVLLVGGYGPGSAVQSSAEIFDPVSNSFIATGSMNAARAGHVAVLLPGGKVLIAGGVGPDWTFLSSAELYDPATGRFSATGPMTVARESHIGVKLRNGRVLIVGGHRGRREQMTIYTSAELYDEATGLFTRTGDMRIRRHKHDAVLLNDGRVLVTGGSDERDSKGAYNSSELFDAASGRFSLGPTMHRERYKHQGTSIVLPDGSVLIAGGHQEAEVFSPSADKFTMVPGNIRMAGQFSAASAMSGGRVLITGGYGPGMPPQVGAWIYSN